MTRAETLTGVEMMSKVIKEIATGMFLSADFSTTAFVDAKRVADVNDATWLEPADDDDACVLASVDGEFEVVDVDVLDCSNHGLYDSETTDALSPDDLGITTEQYEEAIRESLACGQPEGHVMVGDRRVYAAE